MSEARDRIRTMLCDLIGSIAPEAEPASLADEADIREALDLDSIDFSNLIIAVHKRTGLDVPEGDYHHFFTLGGAVAYLIAHGSSVG